MADMIQDAVEWLNGQRVAHLSRTVTYQRGVNTVSVSATLGSTTRELIDDLGADIDITIADFIIEAATLILASVLITPQRGDLIILGSKTFEVMNLAGAECYRPSDADGVMLRIHVKETA